MNNKKDSFGRYAIYGLILYLICGAGWLYFDYQDHAKWFRWQQMIDSGKYQPVDVKLTRIQRIEETGSLSASGRTHQPTIHYQGWLTDKNGVFYKTWIFHSKLSEVKVGDTYKLYKIGGVTLVPAFIETRQPQYTVSSAGWAGLGLLAFMFLFYLALIRFALKLKNKNGVGLS